MSADTTSQPKSVLVDLLIDSLPEPGGALGPIETVSLTWEQRSRPRRRCFTDKGKEIALALPRGTVLNDGMLLHNTEKRTVKVVAAPEDVLVIYPDNKLQMCVIAHHLGNWHRSLQLEDDGALIIEVDEPLVKWLEFRKIQFERSTRPYHPNLKGASHD
ncbi:MAG TPA: urease accessory protein UreE [Oculatellaceae cyanobacterium]